MPLHCQDALKKIRAGKELALGLGIHHMRGSAAPMMAKAAGFDWLFIDAEHGFISTPEIAQICLAALPQGVVPIVRICRCTGSRTSASASPAKPAHSLPDATPRRAASCRSTPMAAA